jgi:hypothetical protein
MSSKPFEEVALKLVTQPSRDALKTFLLSRLVRLPEHVRISLVPPLIPPFSETWPTCFSFSNVPQEVTQQTLLCIWLVEIFLNKLNALRDAGQTAQVAAVREDLEAFLEKWKARLDKETVYHLIMSQGNHDVLLAFAKIIKDHDTVIKQLVLAKNWSVALKELSRQVTDISYFLETDIWPSEIGVDKPAHSMETFVPSSFSTAFPNRFIDSSIPLLNVVCSIPSRTI